MSSPWQATYAIVAVRSGRSGPSSPANSPSAEASQRSPASRLALTARNAAGLAGVFITLLLIGTGMVMFARPPLEVVSDTVAHSFGRAFVVGLLGQISAPDFRHVVVGLIS
jgi:hypothetical protein